MIGKTLNHFKILDRLGKGGMGEVYVAEDGKLKRRLRFSLLDPITIGIFFPCMLEVSSFSARKALLLSVFTASRYFSHNFHTAV